MILQKGATPEAKSIHDLYFRRAVIGVLAATDVRHRSVPTKVSRNLRWARKIGQVAKREFCSVCLLSFFNPHAQPFTTSSKTSKNGGIRHALVGFYFKHQTTPPARHPKGRSSSD